MFNTRVEPNWNFFFHLIFYFLFFICDISTQTSSLVAHECKLEVERNKLLQYLRLFSIGTVKIQFHAVKLRVLITSVSTLHNLVTKKSFSY